MSEITQDENCHLGIRETTIVDLTIHEDFTDDLARKTRKML